MEFYSGIDLSARDSSICVIDGQQEKVREIKLRNDLGRIIEELTPYKPNLQIVVESTFNWYWLVDGLREAGFNVCLAHTLGLHMITGAKIKTDRRDAYSLAKLLRVSMIPKAYIYPPETRPIRDLLRRRLSLVRQRANEYSSIRHLLMREGILDHSRNQMKRIEEQDLEKWFKHPLLRLHAIQEVERIGLYTAQIEELEERILAEAKPNKEIARLQEVPGIGPILSLTIFYEIGEISRFKSVRNLSSYSRLIPGVAQSGTVNRRGRASKQGNPYLKNAFTQAAIAAVRWYPEVERYYESHLKKRGGKASKLVAYNIVAHKLAQAVYHILRYGVSYQKKLLFSS